MSEIKVNSIKGVAASSAAISINNTDGTCTANITSLNGGQFSNRNKLINGENLISQRGTSETGVGGSNGYFTVDRWQFANVDTDGRYTVTQDSSAPAGFANSTKLDCTTADTSLQADSGVILRQIIEEQNLHDFRKGFSDAKQFTLSFYVKTTKTGTYVCELYDMRNTRHVSATYTVSDTNWNRYTITFPADITGAFNKASNSGGMIVHWWLVAGTNYTSGSLGTTWGNTAANRAVGQLNFADSTSNDFYLTGCQLEVGSVATDFEHRSFAQELALCQRYFCQDFAPNHGTIYESWSGPNGKHATFNFPVQMRAAPTVNTTNGVDGVVNSQFDNGQGSAVTVSKHSSVTSAYFYQVSTAFHLTGLTVGSPAASFSAEL